MRFVLDLQAAQRHYGFSAHSERLLALALAFTRAAAGHQVVISLSSDYPVTLRPIRALFADLLPAMSIRVWYAPRSGDGKEQVGTFFRGFLLGLQADCVLLTGASSPDAAEMVVPFSVNGDLPAVLLLQDTARHQQAPHWLEWSRRQGWRTATLSCGPREMLDAFYIPQLSPTEPTEVSLDDNIPATWIANGAALLRWMETATPPPKMAYDQLLERSIRELGSLGSMRAAERELAARCIAANLPQPRNRRLYLDISDLVRSDRRTGIQRVTRSILKALADSPPAGYTVEAVWARPGRAGYRTAVPDMSVPNLLDGELIDPQPGDVLLHLDFAAGAVLSHQSALHWMRNHGVRIFFVVYDLLPITLPQYFPSESTRGHVQWLRLVSAFDGAVCISRAVEAELAAWLDSQPGLRHRGFKTGWFHLGADLESSVPTTGIPNDAYGVLESAQARPSFLMVGTVEPRKGHAGVLAAFEFLWNLGDDVLLVIAGKQGWMVEELSARLRSHPELGRRLYWIENGSDEYIERLYRSCTCLVAASLGEGFGLPLIEAARYGTPILARDLPVCREVAGSHAAYFADDSAEGFAARIREWLHLHRQGATPASREMPSVTWQQSALQLLSHLHLESAN